MTAAILVATGTAISGFWILSANSWMHTPAGYQMRGGIAYPLDWLQVIFNPSFPYRFAHMMCAAYLTTSVVVLAVGARYLLQGDFAATGVWGYSRALKARAAAAQGVRNIKK